MAFATQVQDEILTLTLDTPGSSVNIFSHDVSLQLQEILAKVEPSRTRAVIFRSAKPMSFINGVGLMLANAVHSHEDAIELTEVTRRSYRAVKECPVPTIAAIQGNCYGCGVEFVLNCDYRLAAETFDTHFYMTEIHDYLFIPAFGGTQNLPAILGMKKAIDLVIWGEKWSAKEAERYGLIDQSAPPADFEAALSKIVEWGVPRKTPRSARKLDTATVRAAEKRIAALPPQYQRVYRDCLDLMVRAFQKETLTEADYERELLKSAKSVMVEGSKHALSFFFIRQTAQGVSLRALQTPSPRFAIAFEADDRAILPLRRELEKRSLATVRISSEPEVGESLIRFVSRERAEGAGQGIVTIADLSLKRLCDNPTGVVAYFPGFRKGMRFAEIVAPASEAASAAKVAKYLGLVGFSTIVTRPGSDLVTNRLVGAFFAALLTELWDGADAAALSKTLRSMGFIRSPGETLEALREIRPLAALVVPHLPERYADRDRRRIERDLQRLGKADYRKGTLRPSMLDTLCLSLLAAVRGCFAEGSVGHPALIDLAAREVLDFPLAHRSLCAYLSKERVERILGRAERRRNRPSEEARSAARGYLEQKHGFYL